MLDKKVNFYEFNTTIKYNNSYITVYDFCTHYTLEEAIESVKKFNEDRGYKVIDIKPLIRCN